MTIIRTYLYINAHIIAFSLLLAFGHVCRLALYDIRLSHIVKETSALFAIFIKEIASTLIHLQL